MRKLLIGLLFLVAVCFAEPARAQCSSYTQVTGTVQDPDNIPYANAVMAVALSGPGGGPTTCTGTDGFQHPINPPSLVTFSPAGTFAIQLPPNSIITPGGTQWIFTVTISPGAALPLGTGPQTFTVDATISGASQDLSAVLSAAAPSLSNVHGGGSANPCTVTANAIQKNNAGAFGCADATDDGTIFEISEVFAPLSWNFNTLPTQALSTGTGQPIIYNGTFEANSQAAGTSTSFIPAWFPGNATLSLDTTSPYAGGASLKDAVTGANPDDGALYETQINATPGDTWSVTAEVHGDGTISPEVVVGFWKIPGGSPLSVITASGTSSTSWQSVSATGVVPATATYAEIFLTRSGLSTGTVEFDNVDVQDLSTAPATTAPLQCADTSGSATAQSCSTLPSFTPVKGNVIIYSTTTSNSGALTLNVDSSAADAVQKWGGSALAAGDIVANLPVKLIFDGSHWQLGGDIGNAPSGTLPSGASGQVLCYTSSWLGCYLGIVPTPETNTTITMAQADSSGLFDYILTSGGPYTQTLFPAANNAFVVIANDPTSTISLAVAPPSGTMINIGGCTITSGDVVLTANQRAQFTTNNTNWYALCLTTPPLTPSTLTDGATITWALAGASPNATVTLAGNRTLDITGPASGDTYVLRVVQDATGSRTLTLGTGCTWKVIGGGSGAITLSTAANAIDVLSFYYDGTNCYANLGKNYN